MKNISTKRILVILIVIVIAAFLVLKKQRGKYIVAPQKVQTSSATQANSVGSNAGDGLVRNPSTIHYSKHAKCRMDCRHIDEAEVREILTNGTINFRKSELNNAECRNRYAVEGRTKDGQDLRIIFAPCGEEETVVTVIDLGREWSCDCK